MFPDFVIEKGIPAPPRPSYRDRAGRPALYDWDQMEPGDSVLMPTRSAAWTAYTFGARHGRVFQVEKRSVGERGWRVWRTA
jgi:hypothetical protein